MLPISPSSQILFTRQVLSFSDAPLQNAMVVAEGRSVLEGTVEMAESSLLVGIRGLTLFRREFSSGTGFIAVDV